MSVRVFVSADSSALSVGADRVSDAIRDEARRRGLDIELVRTGSRGLFCAGEFPLFVSRKAR